jgi:hypothetical protein
MLYQVKNTNKEAEVINFWNNVEFRFKIKDQKVDYLGRGREPAGGGRETREGYAGGMNGEYDPSTLCTCMKCHHESWV